MSKSTHMLVRIAQLSDAVLTFVTGSILQTIRGPDNLSRCDLPFLHPVSLSLQQNSILPSVIPEVCRTRGGILLIMGVSGRWRSRSGQTEARRYIPRHRVELLCMACCCNRFGGGHAKGEVGRRAREQTRPGHWT